MAEKRWTVQAVYRTHVEHGVSYFNARLTSTDGAGPARGFRLMPELDHRQQVGQLQGELEAARKERDEWRGREMALQDGRKAQEVRADAAEAERDDAERDLEDRLARALEEGCEECEARREAALATVEHYRSGVREALNILGNGECPVNHCEGCKADDEAVQQKLQALIDTETFWPDLEVTRVVNGLGQASHHVRIGDTSHPTRRYVPAERLSRIRSHILTYLRSGGQFHLEEIKRIVIDDLAPDQPSDVEGEDPLEHFWPPVDVHAGKQPTGLEAIEQAIWSEYLTEHDAEIDPENWPQWLIGAALAVDDLRSTQPDVEGLVEEVEGKAASARELRDDYYQDDDTTGSARCHGKAQAYSHAAQLAREQLLGDSRG